LKKYNNKKKKQTGTVPKNPFSSLYKWLPSSKTLVPFSSQ